MTSPVFVRPLTTDEQATLQKFIDHPTRPDVARRAKIIQYSSRGFKATEIATAINVTIPTVIRTIHRFNRDAFHALFNIWRSGRPCKVSPHYVRVLRRAVRQSPRKYGYEFDCWTLKDLQQCLARETGISLSPRYLSQLMAKNAISYRGAKHQARLRAARQRTTVVTTRKEVTRPTQTESS